MLFQVSSGYGRFGHVKLLYVRFWQVGSRLFKVGQVRSD
jgi:hypothetical protein